jgi:hypothetical protein
LEFRGTHHSRVGSWVGESLWCRNSLLLIGWLWAQLSSGWTHCTYVRACVRACVHRNISLSPFLPNLWTMAYGPPYWKGSTCNLNRFRNICISLLRSPGSKTWMNVLPYILFSRALLRMFISSAKHCTYLFAILVCLHTTIAILVMLWLNCSDLSACFEFKSLPDRRCLLVSNLITILLNKLKWTGLVLFTVCFVFPECLLIFGSAPVDLRLYSDRCCMCFWKNIRKFTMLLHSSWPWCYPRIAVKF